METRIAAAVLLITAFFTSGIPMPPVNTEDEQSIYQKTQFENNDQIDSNRLEKMHLPFIENLGQMHDEVKFYADVFAGRIFVTNDGLTYALINGTPQENENLQSVALKETFLTENVVYPIGLEKSHTIVNYFVGEREEWRSNIPSYNGISLGELWSFIDVELYAYGKNVEKIFKVKAGGNVEDIKLGFEGVEELNVTEKGELLLETDLGTIVMTKPVAFQEIDGAHKPVNILYLVDGTTYGFTVGKYDPRYTLVIDPLLSSTFIGGTSGEIAFAMTLDGSGNVFVTGVVGSSDYPTTTGAFDHDYNGGGDVFISKLDSDLTTLLASTFIGGNSELGEASYAIALDGSGNVFVTGYTDRSNYDNYPTTNGAYDETHNGGRDVFISKLDSDLTTILASTLIGGDGHDTARGLVLDGSGNVFVTGDTSSTNYPPTTGVFDEDYNGGGDVFISKLDSDLTTLLASTFIGESQTDLSMDMVLDGSGNVFVTGASGSSDYPTTAGAYDMEYNGGNGLFATPNVGGFPSAPQGGDVFISKLDSDLTTLLASTFIGGSHDDTARRLVLDGSGNVFVTGLAHSINYPTTAGAHDITHNGVQDVFISKLDSDLTTLLASTFIGGSDSEEGLAVSLDGSGNVFVTGDTHSNNYPVTTNAFDETYNGGSEIGGDAFISKFNGDLTTLTASTFVGGDRYDEAFAIAVDGSDILYMTGHTSSGLNFNYPTTRGAYDETHNGQSDVFVSKLSGDLAAPSPVPVPPGSSLKCRGFEVTIMGTSGNDVIEGTPNDDVIHGRAGSDTIYGRGGNDVICGGGGSDIIYGEDGLDTLDGMRGSDHIEGGTGQDSILGGAGDDYLFGDADDDYIFGKAGNDTIDCGDGYDLGNGGSGRGDTVSNCESPIGIP